MFMWWMLTGTIALSRSSLNGLCQNLRPALRLVVQIKRYCKRYSNEALLDKPVVASSARLRR